MNFYSLTCRRSLKNDISFINIIEVLYYFGVVVTRSASEVSKPLNNISKIKNCAHIASFLMYLSWNTEMRIAMKVYNVLGRIWSQISVFFLNFKEVLSDDNSEDEASPCQAVNKCQPSLFFARNTLITALTTTIPFILYY